MRESDDFAFKVFDKIGLGDEFRKMENVYIYGAGIVGKQLFRYLKKKGLANKVKAFLVSHHSEKKDFFEGIEITSAESALNCLDSCVVIAVRQQFRDEILVYCESIGLTVDFVLDDFSELEYKYYSLLDESEYPEELMEWYKRTTGKTLDLNNPVTFNEKINWLKIYDKDIRKTRLADKYLVREYVQEKIGNKYLIPLLGVWNSFDEILFDELPDRFALKCNHGCGWNYLIPDKSQIDRAAMKKDFDRWLGRNYAWEGGFELHYTGIKPRIIAEQYLDSPNNYIPECKVFAFDGKVQYLWIDIDKHGNHRRNLYTRDWEYLPYEIRYPTAPDVVIDKPEWLEEIIEISEKLADHFLQVRLDYYILNGNLYFGEITFTQGSGIARMEPYEFEVEFGKYIDINKLERR